jgi:putative hemolysin
MLARPMRVLSVVTAPFVWLLTSTNDVLLSILGIKKSMDSSVTEEEIKSIIKESAEGGEIQDIEQNIVERVFELGDRKVKSLITHRSDLVFFDEMDDFNTMKQKINQEKHAAYPVCKNNDLDNIRGIVFLKDLFAVDIPSNFIVKSVMKAPLFVNDHVYAYKLLETFKKEKMHYAIVIDEYGVTKGIVTMDDVVDALVGDVTEHDQSEYQIIQRDENSWLVDGIFPIIEFVKYFNLELGQLDNNFVTVAGLFINQSDSLPQVGDTINIEDLQLEIIDKDAQRIDKILVTKI